MSNQPLTERVQDAPTIRQRVGGFFLNYVVPPVAAAGFFATLAGFALVSVRLDDVTYCHERISISQGRKDPEAVYGPRTRETCAELFRFEEGYQRAFRNMHP